MTLYRPLPWLLPLLLLALIPLSCSQDDPVSSFQPPNTTWFRSINRTFSAPLRTTVPLPEGGYVAAGTDGTSGWLMKLTDQATVISELHLTYPVWDVIPAGDGFVIATTIDDEVTLIQLDGSYQEIWRSGLNRTGSNVRLAMLDTGGYAVGFVSGNIVFEVVATNSSGRQLSRSVWRASTPIVLEAMARDRTGSVGVVLRGDTRDATLTFIRISRNGVDLAPIPLGDTGDHPNRTVTRLVPRKWGGYLLTGGITSVNGFPEGMWIAELREDGLVRWEHVIDDTDMLAYHAASLPDDGFIVTGRNDEDPNRALLIRLDSRMREQWRQDISVSPEFNIGYSVYPQPDGYFLVFLQRVRTDRQAVTMARLNPEGTLR